MNKPFKSRTEADLEMVVPYIKAIDFFKERDIKDSDLPDIVACMTHEHFKAGAEVFKLGNLGL